MLNEAPEPDDFICCTGITTSVRDFCDLSFKMINSDYKHFVYQDKKYLRDEELDYLKVPPENSTSTDKYYSVF